MDIQLPKIHRAAESLSWSIYGTTCEEVRKLAMVLMQLSPRISSYIDAEHQDGVVCNQQTMGLKGAQGNSIFKSPSPWKIHWINGNHFPAEKQIVIHDPKKIDSLFKRRNQLTHLSLVLSEEGIPPHLWDWGVVSPDTVCLSPADASGIAHWVEKEISISPMAALILTGGKSERMGTDKSMLEYHGIPQWKYLKRQCESLSLPFYISCNKEQQGFWTEQGLNTVVDEFQSMGPVAGILSAMKQHPEYSWLVMACDMPNWNADAMNQLIKNRNAKAGATAFFNEEKNWCEPLAAIWENDVEGPLHQWSWVSRCPRKFLNQLPTQSVHLNEKNWVDNVNDLAARNDWFKRQGG